MPIRVSQSNSCTIAAAARTQPEVEYAEPNYQSYAVRLKDGARVTRNRILEHLLECGIAAKPGVMTAHREPAYRDCGAQFQVRPDRR